MDLEKKNVFYNELLNLINGLKDEVKELKEESKKRKREDDDGVEDNYSISGNNKRFEPSTSDMTISSQRTVVASKEDDSLVPISCGDILDAKEFIHRESGGYDMIIRRIMFNCNVNDMLKYKLKNKRYNLKISKRKSDGAKFLHFEVTFSPESFSEI